MLLTDLIKQDENKKIVENPGFIEFSKRTVRFGNSIYQLRNITGFEVGEIPKQKLQIIWVLVLIVVGILLLAVVVGLLLIGIAVWMLNSHFSQPQKYGFIMELNSGGNIYFITKDKEFLRDIASAIYKLMEGDIDGMTVNWQDRSVKINNMHGVINAGDDSNIEYNS